MDLGYSILVFKYYEEQSSEKKAGDILEGEKSYIFIALYTLDFCICVTILVLFYTYSVRSTEKEEKLKKYYLMSIRTNAQYT